MKRLCGIVAVLLLVCNEVFAMTPINGDTIKVAQEYGAGRAQVTLTEFLNPWTAYEEKAVKLNETAEHAYLYTTFLLIAADAREKALNGKRPALLDSEKIIADYSGTLTFSVCLFGNDIGFTRNPQAVIKQGDKTIKAYYIAAPQEAGKSPWSGEPYTAQCYFYFSDTEIDQSSPIILIISTNDKREHRFYFNLPNVK